MSKFKELQAEHVRLLEGHEKQKESPELLQAVKAYTEQVISASREIGDSHERNQLRANLRFWGSHIYDRTGLYPNLSLLPSEGGTSAPAASVEAKPTRKGWIITASLLLLIIVSLGLFLSGNRPLSMAPAATEAQATIDPISLVATSAAQNNDDVQILATATALAAAIQSGTPMAGALTATPVLNFATPTYFLLPSTGGGGAEVMGQAYSSIDIQDGTSCSGHRINISILHDFTSAASLEPATLTVSEEGALRQIVERQVPLQQADAQVAVTTEVDIADARGSYLVYLDHPKLTFDAVIVQHLPDCQGNLVNIEYEVSSAGYEELEPRPNPGLKFNLVAWGPHPMTTDYGVAKIRVTSTENTAEPIFWLYSWDSGQYELIENDEFLADSDVDYNIGVTSAGRTVSIPFRLVTPYVGYTPGE